MNTLNLVTGIIDCAAGAMLIALSLPTLRGSSRRNTLYGFRFRQAFSSEQQWREINRYGARWMTFWASALLIIGVVAFFIPFGGNTTLALLWIIIPALIIPTIPVIQTSRYAKHATG